MCQLLGLSSNKEVDIQLSLREFRHRGSDNPDGWGFAYYENDRWNVFKKPDSLINENVDRGEFQSKSKVIVGHVRKISCGESSHKNTHPFQINNWVFAHNGTVSAIINNPEFPLGKYQPQGQTDSEYAFCYLLDKIEEVKSIDEIRNILETESEKIRIRCRRIDCRGNFNYLLSNGDFLFSYGDDCLYYVIRRSPFQKVTLIDDNYQVNLEAIKAHDEKAVIVATEPLTTEKGWKEISGLKIWKNGEEIKLSDENKLESTKLTDEGKIEGL